MRSMILVFMVGFLLIGNCLFAADGDLTVGGNATINGIASIGREAYVTTQAPATTSTYLGLY